MRKVLCIVLIFILCSFTIYSFAEDTNTTENSNTENISTLQEEQKGIQTQLEQSGEQLTEVQDELTENLEQIQKLDEKIEASEEELKTLNEKIDKLSQNIKQLEEKLKIANKNYHKQKKLLESRLITMYESGENEYLDVLLSSASMSDFISGYFLITEIASYDTELLEDVEEKKQIIELADERLTDNMDQLEIMKKNQETNNKILQNVKTMRENYVAKLTEQEKEIQDKIDEYKTQFEQVNKEILEVALSQGFTADYIGGIMEWPVPGYTKITSPFAMRVHPITGVYKLHTGVDISAPMGANFIAANSGLVTKAYYNGAYGNMVLIDHGGGISTLYAHGSEILVQVGQMVNRGDPVLKVGSTGYSTGPHAHFEVRINGVPTNPIDYITKSKIPETVNSNTNNNTTNTTNTVNTNNTVSTTEANTSAQETNTSTENKVTTSN